MSISVVINTKNAAETLSRVIKSVHDLANEVVVVDMKSTDDTVKIATELGAKVFAYPHDLGFADPARNWALRKASSEWILVLDADEEVSSSLCSYLLEIVKNEVDAKLVGDCYFLPRQNIIFGQALMHTGWWPDYQLRFFKKGTVQWTDRVHTHPVARGKVIYLPAQEKFAILHHNYQSVNQFVDRLNRYTEFEAAIRPEIEQLTGSQVIESFSNEFLRRFFAEEGWRDGTHGISLAFLQSFYEITASLKQWQRGKFVPTTTAKLAAEKQTILTLAKFRRDLGYWLADWQVKHSSGLVKIYWMIRRKLAI